jgi:hypothetical protein
MEIIPRGRVAQEKGEAKRKIGKGAERGVQKELKPM